MSQRKQAIIYETSLREGMQTPGGIGAGIEERIYAANLIARYADYIEVGMPANDVEYGMISAIRKSITQNKRDVGIAVLCRNHELDINRAAEVLEGYPKTLAHLFIGTSEEHRGKRFGGKWKTGDYEKNIRDSVEYAASKPFTEIMFSPEDSYRTFMQSPENFFMFVDAAIEGYVTGRKKSGVKMGVPILNFPDTVGYSTISEFNEMLDKIITRYGDRIAISVHCHDDSHMSTAQAVEVYMSARANWLQTTFARMGERSGIAATEEVIAILDQRGMLNGKKFANDHDRALLVPTTHAVLASMGRTVPDETGISGSRTSVSTAGIHTSIAHDSHATYHIFASMYGAKPRMEFGPTSGAEQIMYVLQSVGVKDDKKSARVSAFTNEMKTRCNDEKRFLDEVDIKYGALKFFYGMADVLTVDNYALTIDMRAKTHILISGKYNGNSFTHGVYEVGGVEAIVAALHKVVGNGRVIELVDFRTSVVPKIPASYLSWNPGEFPKIPGKLSIESSLRANVRIRTNNGSRDTFEDFTGHSCLENSIQAIIESVIDATVKMSLIKEWEKTKPK